MIEFININDFAEYVVNEYEFEDIQQLNNSVSISVHDITVFDMIRMSHEVKNLSVVKYNNRFVELTCF